MKAILKEAFGDALSGPPRGRCRRLAGRIASGRPAACCFATAALLRNVVLQQDLQSVPDASVLRIPSRRGASVERPPHRTHRKLSLLLGRRSERPSGVRPIQFPIGISAACLAKPNGSILGAAVVAPAPHLRADVQRRERASRLPRHGRSRISLKSQWLQTAHVSVSRSLAFALGDRVSN